MSQNDPISEQEALQRFSNAAEGIHQKLEAFPGDSVNTIKALYSELKPNAETPRNKECTMAAWYRENDGEKPWPADAKLLEELRTDIPQADEIIQHLNHLMMLNIILAASRKGWSVADLCELMDAGEDIDRDTFQQELYRIKANRKLPN